VASRAENDGDARDETVLVVVETLKKATVPFE
jgi:hypothetical protein